MSETLHITTTTTRAHCRGQAQARALMDICTSYNYSAAAAGHLSACHGRLITRGRGGAFDYTPYPASHSIPYAVLVLVLNYMAGSVRCFVEMEHRPPD